MDALEAALGKVQREIDQVAAEAETAAEQGREEDLRFWRKEKEQLREEKEQLRTEKEQLGEKELVALRASGKHYRQWTECLAVTCCVHKDPSLLRLL